MLTHSLLNSGGIQRKVLTMICRFVELSNLIACHQFPCLLCFTYTVHFHFYVQTSKAPVLMSCPQIHLLCLESQLLSLLVDTLFFKPQHNCYFCKQAFSVEFKVGLHITPPLLLFSLHCCCVVLYHNLQKHWHVCVFQASWHTCVQQRDLHTVSIQ